MHVYVCIYVHTCMHKVHLTHSFVFFFAFLGGKLRRFGGVPLAVDLIYIYMYIYICVCVCVCVCVYNIYIYIYIYICVYLFLYLFKYMHA